MSVGAVSVAVFGCTPPHPHAKVRAPFREISSLNCPADQDALRLQSKSPDGKTCTYVSSAADQVTLALLPLVGGDVRAALAPVEAALNAELPMAAKGNSAAGASASNWVGDKDHVDLDLPGIHIHSRGDGQADIDTGGVHVSAHDDSGSSDHRTAQVVIAGGRHGGVTVDAHEGGAQIRVNESGAGVRQAYMLESDHAGPNGYRLAGYEARGPAQGPIVVAKILAKAHDADDLRHDVRDLLKLNVGG